jgi:uncharacterized membrane protein
MKLLISHEVVIFFINIPNEKRMNVVISVEQNFRPYQDLIKVKQCKMWKKHMVLALSLLVTGKEVKLKNSVLPELQVKSNFSWYGYFLPVNESNHYR